MGFNSAFKGLRKFVIRSMCICVCDWYWIMAIVFDLRLWSITNTMDIKTGSNIQHSDIEINSYIHSNNQNRGQCYVTYVSIVFRLLPGFAADAPWMLPEEKLWVDKGEWPPLYHQLQCGCSRRHAVPCDGCSWNWYGHSAISLAQTVVTFFFTKVNQAMFKIIVIYNTQQQMCWQLQAISIFCSKFSVTIVAAELLHYIFIIRIIPGFPVD